MINIHTIGDITNAVEKKAYGTHGGFNFLGLIFLNRKGKAEVKRVMELRYSEIIEYIHGSH